MKASGRGWPGVLSCGLALAAAAVTVQVQAQAQVVDTAGYLERMDSDGDGRVSLDEYLAWMTYAFKRMDRDGNGVLEGAELPGGKGPPVALDGYRARLADRFNRQDANGDGFLDAGELGTPPR